ncbi:iron uptake porin, partial [Spirulina sp. 06S082]|uniref:iron uptake porin n=1 Tax=Spirulina sp. 06S082 TaxID=3110248 RepID=UPI002B1EACB0
MFKLCEMLSKSSAIALCFALCTASSAIAIEILPIDSIDGEAIDSLETDPLAELTSVQQLSDVEPTDWAYEALNSLMERYGIIAGYPDLTFRGDRVLSRYEFAAALNALTSRLEDILAKTTSDLALQEDIATLQRLQSEFAIELATLGTRVDALESRVTQLEENSFSTTTKLNWAAFISPALMLASGDSVKAEGTLPPGGRFRIASRDATTNEPVVDIVTDAPEFNVSKANLITFASSFTGRDALIINLLETNTDPPQLQYASANFSGTFGTHVLETNPVGPIPDNSLALLELFYKFPIGDSLVVTVAPKIYSFRAFDENLYTGFLNGAAMTNSLISPLFLNPDRGSGVLVDWKISSQLELRFAYLSDNAESGEFLDALGKFSNLTAQLNWHVSDRATIRVAYDRGLLLATPPGSVIPGRLTNAGRGFVDDGFGGELKDTFTHNFLFNFDWTITDKFGLFGRYTYSTAHLTPRSASRSESDISMQSFQFGLAFPDLGKQGALGTLSFVVPLNIISGREFIISGNGDGGTEFNMEATYFFPITDNISIVLSIYGVIGANNFSSNPF